MRRRERVIFLRKLVMMPAVASVEYKKSVVGGISSLSVSRLHGRIRSGEANKSDPARLGNRVDALSGIFGGSYSSLQFGSRSLNRAVSHRC
jgi:hypothetical protein